MDTAGKVLVLRAARALPGTGVVLIICLCPQSHYTKWQRREVTTNKAEQHSDSSNPRIQFSRLHFIHVLNFINFIGKEQKKFKNYINAT